MPRPRRSRWVSARPNITYFKPSGVPTRELDETVLTIEEFEAVRLKDQLELDQQSAAERMKVSQPTFHRLLNGARKKIADAIINGKALRIQGGNYTMVQEQPQRRGMGCGKGQGCGNGFGRGNGVRGQGMRQESGTGRSRCAGSGGNCVCPKCKTLIPKQHGVPCREQTCPQCGTLLISDNE